MGYLMEYFVLVHREGELFYNQLVLPDPTEIVSGIFFFLFDVNLSINKTESFSQSLCTFFFLVLLDGSIFD